MLNAETVYSYFNDLKLDHKRLSRVTGSLKRKKIRKVDPFLVTYDFATYFYSSDDDVALTDLYKSLIHPSLDDLVKLEFQFWDCIGPCLLLYADISGDHADLKYFEDKGFVKQRLNRSLYDLSLKNLQKEIAQFPASNYFPKETIVSRYQSLITELVLIRIFNKDSSVDEEKTRYCRFYRTALDNYYLSNDKFYELLQ